MVWLGIYRLTRFAPLPLLRSHRRHKNNKRETSVDDANGTRLTTMPEEAEEEEDGGITIKVGGNYHPEGQLEQTLFLALRRSTAVACFARVSLVSSFGSVWLLLSRSCSLSRSLGASFLLGLGRGGVAKDCLVMRRGWMRVLHNMEGSLLPWVLVLNVFLVLSCYPSPGWKRIWLEYRWLKSMRLILECCD